jgi:hypothetical protein
MTPYLQIRAGYSFFPYTHKQEFDLGTMDIGGKTRDLSKTPFSATLWKGGTGRLLLDIFPGRNTSFHFTVGAIMGPGKMAHVSADLSKALSPEDYATLAITYGEGAEKLHISTDKQGFVHADVKMGSVVPYVGLGFGRAVKPDSRVRVSFDMGALITGGIKLQSYSYLRNEKGDPAIVTSKVLTDEDGRQLDNGWIDRVSNFPVLPMLKLNIFVRLF